MFDFFIRKKEIVLDCYTSSSHVYDYSPINSGIKYLPEWWRRTKKIAKSANGAELGTVKNCPAFIEYYKNSIIIPSWFELQFNMSDNTEKTYDWASSTAIEVNNHDHKQLEEFLGFDGIHLKIMSPWRFKTNKEIKFIWTHPIWNTKDTFFDLTVLPGVIDFYTQHGTHINLFSKFTNQEKHIQILPLTPMVILHPMTEHKIKIVNHLVTEQEMARIDGKLNLKLKITAKDNVESTKKTKHIEKMIRQTDTRVNFPKGETK